MMSEYDSARDFGRDISLDGNGGLFKKTLKEGTGLCVLKGAKVKVHYEGYFLDGTKFDSSYDRKEPLKFYLGDHLIKGWTEGIIKMKKGEIAIITCYPEYAYGNTGYPPIPPNTTIQFYLDILDWMGEDFSPKHDGGIEVVERYSNGIGDEYPKYGDPVEAHIIGSYDQRIFEDREVSFDLGSGSSLGIVEGVEKTLKRLKAEASVNVVIKPQYAFGAQGHQEYKIPPNATVHYRITLHSFQTTKSKWVFDKDDKLSKAIEYKEKGTVEFKNGNYSMAIVLYQNMQIFLSDIEDKDESDKKINELHLASYLNIALCNLKLRKYYQARTFAKKALEKDPMNEKGLFRKGQALVGMGEAQLAFDSFAKCLTIYPNNASAKAQQIVCRKMIKEQLKKEKQVYANMFDKFAKTDTQREENEKEKEPNVMSCVGEWGKEDREREPSEFEKENPNILLLNSSGEFKDM